MKKYIDTVEFADPLFGVGSATSAGPTFRYRKRAFELGEGIKTSLGKERT